MYKVLLVDDEYMITEGLKKLIPFDHWNMEVVATAEDADQALDYVRDHPVDVVITDYGIAINPRRQDLIEAMKDVDLPFTSIEELRDTAYAISGVPERVQFLGRVVGIIESRDGTIMDVVRQIKPFTFSEETGDGQ